MYVLKWHTSALNSLLKSEHGSVAHDLERRGVKVESRAKQNASGRPGPNVDTGRLRSSITHVLGADDEGCYCDVGTNVEYAPYLEYGTVNMPAYPFLKPALAAASE